MIQGCFLPNFMTVSRFELFLGYFGVLYSTTMTINESQVTSYHDTVSTVYIYTWFCTLLRDMELITV